MTVQRRQNQEQGGSSKHFSFGVILTLLVFILLLLQLIALLLDESVNGLQWVGFGFSVLVSAFALYWYRSTLSSPLKEMVETLSSLSSEEGDISQDLDENGSREIGNIARSHNVFTDKLRDILNRVQQQSLNVALSSSQLRKNIQESSRRSDRQEKYSEMIFQSSEETTRAINELSERTQTISSTNTSNLDAAKQSQTNLETVSQQMEAVSGRLNSFSDTIQNLTENSTKISEILQTVQGFSEQTNMLALNAAIEAARAGEAGRGFAVVADEVRTLAEKVKGAADEVDVLIVEMSKVVSETAEGMELIVNNAQEASSAISNSSSEFTRMMEDFQGNHDSLLLMASAIEQLSATNAEIHSRSTEIQTLGKEISGDMSLSEEHSVLLRDATEETLSMLSRFKIGRGRFEEWLEIARKRRDEVQAIMQSLQDRGINMFDRDYRSVPGTSPEKYSTAYTVEIKKSLGQLIDQYRKEYPGIAYHLPADINGFVAVHYPEFSEEPTGDYEHDLNKSRHCRFYFSNETEKRRVQSTAPFILQTYLRDNGDVLFDITLPIYISGKHWGGMPLGLQREALIE